MISSSDLQMTSNHVIARHLTRASLFLFRLFCPLLSLLFDPFCLSVLPRVQKHVAHTLAASPSRSHVPDTSCRQNDRPASTQNTPNQKTMSQPNSEWRSTKTSITQPSDMISSPDLKMSSNHVIWRHLTHTSFSSFLLFYLTREKGTGNNGPNDLISCTHMQSHVPNTFQSSKP